MSKGRVYLRTFPNRPGTWAGEQGAMQVENEALLSVQPHVLYSRIGVEDFLAERKLRVELFINNDIGPRGPNDEHGLWRFRLVDAGGQPATLTYAEIAPLLQTGGAKHISRSDHLVVHPRGFSLLTDTNKMACWSWNLPAGPTTHFDGTCPSANIAFMFLPSGVIKKNIEKTVATGVTESLAYTRQSIENYVCNGCYALKGAYGNPSMMFSMQVKLLLTKQLLKLGTFEDAMVDAIGAARDSVRRRLTRMEREKKRPLTLDDKVHLPSPDYFRIHDSGDFLKRSYALAWFEVSRRMPQIKFWCPTRVWATPGILTESDLRTVPSNLALRPSALHMNEPAPHLTPHYREGKGGGYSAGSGSGVVGFDKKAWPCPAMMDTAKGGGAVWHPDRHELVDGTCSRARVRHTKQGPVLDPKGSTECRACWNFHDTAVTYKEH